jgi:hypothetical protein
MCPIPLFLTVGPERDEMSDVIVELLYEASEQHQSTEDGHGEDQRAREEVVHLLIHTM